MFKGQNKAMSHGKANKKTEIIVEKIQGKTPQETAQRQMDTNFLAAMVGKVMKDSMK